MILLAQIDDVTALTDAQLDGILTRFERQEQEVSKRRSRLQDRLEFVLAGGAASEAMAEDQLAALQASEREISDERHRLHAQIDVLRAEKSRRRAGQ